MIVCAPKHFNARRVKEPVSLADILPTLVDIATDGKSRARPPDRWPLALSRSSEARTKIRKPLPGANIWPKAPSRPCTCSGAARGNIIHCPTDPDQLFNLVDDPNELNNLAASHPIAAKFHAEVVAKFDIPRINAAVLESQRARLMMFEALKSGAHFPWDFQPLRDASEQYTRNHMSVTDRDLQSRFPEAPDIENKKR